MSDPNLTVDEFDELEALLPWYASGQLPLKEHRRIDTALKHNEVLRSRLALVREEMNETIRSNEALGAPSPVTLDRMMDLIDAEPTRARSPGASVRRLVAKVDDFMTNLAPQTLRYGAALAAVLIVAQGVIIGATYFAGNAPRYVSASGDGAQGTVVGTFALVKFSDKATAKDISALLSRLNATIVAGPKPGGVYRIRLSAKALQGEAKARAMASLRDNKGLVELVLPAGAKE